MKYEQLPQHVQQQIQCYLSNNQFTLAKEIYDDYCYIKNDSTEKEASIIEVSYASLPITCVEDRARQF